MDNSNRDNKLLEIHKTDQISDTLSPDNQRKSDLTKKKPDKPRKEDGNQVDSSSTDPVAIGKSNCGRWIKFQQTLGEGGYKTVFKGYDSEKGNHVAWCEFKPQHVDTKEKQVNMMNEIEIMVKMDHPNIVICHDIFDEYIDSKNPNNPFTVKSIILIQELLGEGTLKSVIKKNFIDGKLILEFPLVLFWLHQIIDALAYMHEKLNPPIIHRDLKADNCFLESKSSDKYLNVKVGDFGLAKQIDNKEKNTMLGTVGFMAPEVYDEKYDAKVDIYAFGMLMLEVITNRTPYDDCETVMQVAKQTMSGRLPDIFSLVSDPWTREVISCCIHPLPTYRPTAMELFYHPIFLQACDYEDKYILPIAITPNSDSLVDRETIINNFIKNMITDNDIYNTKFNLRMEFRNKRLQKAFDLDEGESLEFDLDVFKQEDVPELIANLKSEYEENIIDALNPNKINDTKSVNVQLEKFFKSMESQMNFIMKMILGKRWHYILEGMLSKQNDLELKDDFTGFSLLANYKNNWLKASKQIETEMSNYQISNTNIENIRISRVFKTSESIKIDSLIVTKEDTQEPENNLPELGNRDRTEANSITKTIKDNNEFLACQVPGYNNPVPSQPLVYPFNCMSFMNPVMVPADTGQMSWQMYNSMQQPIPMAPVNNFRKNSDLPSNIDNKILSSSKPQTVSGFTSKTKETSLSEVTSHTKKTLRESQFDKIFTFEEVMKYISSKSHRNSRDPFIIIPVKNQSNAFYLIKINDSSVSEDKDVEEMRAPYEGKPKKHSNKLRNSQPLEGLYPSLRQGQPTMVPSNSLNFLNQQEMFTQPPLLPALSSNLSSDNTNMNMQFHFMNYWVQQQNLFQQQFLQYQQQLLMQQQQHLQNQQLIQRRFQAQQQMQQMQRKIIPQPRMSQSSEMCNVQNQKPLFDVVPELISDPNDVSELNKTKTESQNPKFVVKKIDETEINSTTALNKLESAKFTLGDDHNQLKVEKEEKASKPVKEKKSKNSKTMENHCNLESIPHQKRIGKSSSVLINSQGECSVNHYQKSLDREREVSAGELCLQPSSSQTNNEQINVEKETFDTTNSAASTGDFLKMSRSGISTGVNKNEETIKYDKRKSDPKVPFNDLNRSSTFDFTYSQSI